MKYFVYIIYSPQFDLYYKGYSTDPQKRLLAHNSDESRFTRGKGPWELVYTKGFETKQEALKEEIRLKKLNRISIKRIIAG